MGILNKARTALLMIFLITLLSACPLNDSSDGTNNSGATEPAGKIVNALGLAITEQNAYEPVILNLEGMAANTSYFITISAPDSTQLNPPGGFVAITDEEGKLDNHTIVQYLGQVDSSSAIVLNGAGHTPLLPPMIGNHTIEIRDISGALILSLNFTTNYNGHLACQDSSGAIRASFLPTENVFAHIDVPTLADGLYNLFIFPDLNTALQDGNNLSISSAVAANIANGMGNVDLGIFTSGSFDLVFDVNGNLIYDQDIDLISRHPRFHACFSIQTANTGGPIIGQICSDQYGNYRDVFDPDTTVSGNIVGPRKNLVNLISTSSAIRDMYATYTPTEQSQVQHSASVGKYVVDHQDTWNNGDILTDVTNGIEMDAVQSYAISEAPWRIWPRQLMNGGCYDVIIDVNNNGVFDVGTDFVDNIDNTGATTCGCRVGNSSCSDNITITSHEGGDEVTSTAITLEGNVLGNPVSGAITLSSGAQANTINLSITNGAFSVNLPLFNGTNQITVYFIYADGSTCSKTIAVTSSATSSSNDLFRAQLTWDGDTDMDLHLVRPGGTYSNGGGGEGDCNFSNCLVGLEGNEANSIDWGLPGRGEEDDPKLDVDCVACGNGIENIWMNSISEDGAYTVYVDAFNGTETDVTVSIFILGTRVGQVNCGNMSSSTTIDSCRVGIINWNGGDNGSGSFTPDGTTAPDF